MKRTQNTPLNIVEKINTRISLISAVAVLILLTFLFCRLDHQLVTVPAEKAEKQEAEEQQQAETRKKEPVVTTATVIAAGDNFYQSGVLVSGQDGSGNWSYTKVYDHIKNTIQAADLAIVNQETIFTGSHNSVNASGYYATPTEVGDALVNAGFDVICSASNHADDWGADYITETINYWNNSHPEILVTGIHSSEEDVSSVRVFDAGGIRVAVLNYTYGTNAGSAGSGGTYLMNTGGRNYMVDVLSQGSEKISEMIRSARSQADCVIFVAHFGTTDEPMPSEYEKQWASFLMKEGVDVLIGSHPHVLQPYGVMSDNDGHSMTVFYSLGNFVSSSDNWIERLGGLAGFTIRKSVSDEGTDIEIVDPTVTPVVMHSDNDTSEYSVYLLDEYTRKLAESCSIRNTQGELFSLTNLYRKFEEIMSIRVTPSSGTDLLNVRFNADGSLVDEDGNYVTMLSSTAAAYYSAMDIDISDYSYFENYDYSGGGIILPEQNDTEGLSDSESAGEGINSEDSSDEDYSGNDYSGDYSGDEYYADDYSGDDYYGGDGY